MKLTTTLGALLICLLATGPARAENVELNTLPAAAQKAIQKEQGKYTIKSIDKGDHDGKVRYKVVMEEGTTQRRLFVDDKGKLLRLKQDVEEKTLPAKVRKTMETEGKGATFKRSTKVTHDGKTEYEVEWTVDGRSKTVLMDPAGKVEKTEEVVDAGKLPLAVKAAVEKSAGAGKLLKAVAITPAGKPTIYEAQYESGGKKSEVKIDGSGKVLEKE